MGCASTRGSYDRDPERHPPTRPYAEAAVGYWQAGWPGPIPVTGKSPPITGYTGKEGAFPSFADVSAWIEGPQGDLNVALRLPRNVVGIDIDCWASKAGASTIADRENRWGPLPATPHSTSRDDGSRIQLYRVPEGLVWRGDLGKGSGVDIIQHSHRYVVCAPSRHPDTGSTYTWFHPDGAVMDGPPTVDELAELPEAWITGLTSTQAEDQRTPRRESLPDGVSAPRACHDGPIPYGSRHTALVSYAGSLRHRGLRIDEAEVLMLRRLEDCAQPPAAPTLVTRVEALDTLRDVFQRYPAGDLRPPAGPAAAPRAAVAGGKLWNARPVLGHIRDFARARRASPWATLGVVLARVVVATPPSVVLPALMGGQASLNLFVGLVGESGSGKGAAAHAAADAIDVGDLEVATVGSGEGIGHLFVRRTRAGIIEQHTEAVLFDIAEIDTLTALRDRRGATLLPELRKAWMGEQLGFGYADPAKRLTIHEHAYRLGLVAGINPAGPGHCSTTETAAPRSGSCGSRPSTPTPPTRHHSNRPR